MGSRSGGLGRLGLAVPVLLGLGLLAGCIGTVDEEGPLQGASEEPIAPNESQPASQGSSSDTSQTDREAEAGEEETGNDTSAADTGESSPIVVYETAARGEPTETLVGAASNDVRLPEAGAYPTGQPGFEPTIGITSDGSIFVSAVGDSSTSLGLAVLRSSDGGETWTDVSPPPPGEGPITLNDPYLTVDEDTDRVFATNTQAGSCQVLSFSDDGGETWTTNPVGCGHPIGIHDHPTTFTGPPNQVETVGYENVVYYCVNRVADAACATSLDGGLTFGPMRPLVFQGQQVNGADSDRPAQNCSSLTAHGTTGPDGTAYLPSARCWGIPTVARSQNDGLTWERLVINETLGTRLEGSDPTTTLHDHEVAFATDEEGNAYALWIAGADGRAYLSTSRDRGETWSPPRAVTPPGVANVQFPTVDADAEGRLAVAFVGTEDTRPLEEMNRTTTWNAYVALTEDALAEAPVFVGGPVNDRWDPVYRGACTKADKCGGMGDFLDVEFGPEGDPWGAFVDLCGEDCTAEDGNDQRIGLVGTLALLGGE